VSKGSLSTAEGTLLRITASIFGRKKQSLPKRKTSCKKTFFCFQEELNALEIVTILLIFSE